MDIRFLSAFLLWCAAANYAILLLSFAFYAARRDWMHRLHGRWFHLSAPRIDGIAYACFGAYKLAIWFLLIVPGLVLHFLG